MGDRPRAALEKAANVNKTTPKWIYWTPRILAILFAGFLALFSLDVISPGLSFGQIVVGLFMHNIPVFVLAAVIWISWKREIVGGIVFSIVGILFLARAAVTIWMNEFIWDALLGSLPLAVPALLVGILFMINWRIKLAGRAAAPAERIPGDR